MFPARGSEPWDQHADAAGALRPEANLQADAEPPGATAAAVSAGLPRADELSDAGTGRLLTLPPAVYLNRAATTPADLDLLSPTVSAATRQTLRHADPGLDADLATWRDPAAMVPKLHLLGPIAVTGIDAPPARRGALLIEIVAYLASHPRGVTVEQLAADLWPHIPDAATKTTPRQSVSMARQWLGVNPHTGHERLPRAVADSAGLKLYRVEDVLVDAELFRRLRLRATGRGEHGIDDLHAALALVTGPPLSGRRPGGYSWLADTPLDHEYTAMIVDVAHLVATHALATGDPAAAAAAARTALDAGALDDIALLDLVAACHAQNQHAEAEEYVRRILANHDAEVEEDLPPRTYEVLRRHGWLPV
jgi:hypothetical protein